MADAFDFAVFGATPVAALLAGLLTDVHRKRVCLVGERWSPYRLARRFELSVTPSARPETWLLLRDSGAETLKLLGALGRGLYDRVDPLFVADRPATADYLWHMRWMAFGLGFATERAVEPAVSAKGAICRIRDAAMLTAGRIEPALDEWLGALGVARFEPETRHAWSRGGGVSLGADGDGVKATTAVLADDAAIADRLRPSDRHRLLDVVPSAGVLGEVSRPLPAGFAAWLDRGVALRQRSGQGPATAIAWGEPDTAHARIGSTLGEGRGLTRGGEAHFTTFDVADGAPLLGGMGPGKAVVLAGLGLSAAFLAPALARWLAGTATDDEARYFAAREVARAGRRGSIRDRPSAALEATP